MEKNEEMLSEVWIGVPVKCRHGHRAVYWYTLDGEDGLEWRPDGVEHLQGCSCPKWGENDGWTRAEGELIIEQGEEY